MTTYLGIILYIGFIYSPGPARYLVTTDKKEMCAVIEKNAMALGSHAIFMVEPGTRLGFLQGTTYETLCLYNTAKPSPPWGPYQPPADASVTNLWEKMHSK